MLYWRILETSDWDHKLMFTIFTEVINQVRSRVISHRLLYNQTSFCNQRSRPLLSIRKNASLRHIRIGFTFQTRRLPSGCNIIGQSANYVFKLIDYLFGLENVRKKKNAKDISFTITYSETKSSSKSSQLRSWTREWLQIVTNDVNDSCSFICLSPSYTLSL